MKQIAYLFPGQGSQYIGMGKDLYENYSEAKQTYDQANQFYGADIRKICFDGPQAELQKTRFAQPAIFVTSIAALRVFEARFKPADEQVVAAAGLSLGEATALTAAGALSFEDSVKFVKARGQFMDEASEERPGTMAAIMGLSLEQIEAVCEQTGAEVGNLNAPSQIVISGKTDCVARAIEACKAAGAKRAIPLDVSGAFHSSCMEPACQRIAEALKSVNVQKPKFDVISNLTASSEMSPDKIKNILVNQMNHRTLWEASMLHLSGRGVKKYYELGPGKVLKGLMRKIDPEAVVVSLGSLEDFKILEETHAA
jgi:[acyl-carrier-protein] S-malonyltransferase